jgi:uncharacterized RDD family membrane protein YckC
LNEPLAPDLVIAPLGRRFLAVLIDGLVLLPVAITTWIFFGFFFGLLSDETYAITSAVGIFYNIGFVAGASATPGKMVMGLYIGDRAGQHVTLQQAVMRYLLFLPYGLIYPMLDLISGLLVLVSIVMVVTDGRHRGLHDRMAGTLVLRGKPAIAVQSM